MNHVFHRTDFYEDKNQSKAKRFIILHFHTYKNAGSTVDDVLRKCFPNAWANYDGPVPEFFIHHSEITIIAKNRAQLKALSSHQIRLPVPICEEIEFLPIVFIRRPELRAASIWRFERSRNDDHPRTQFAQRNTFKEWVAKSLSGPHSNAICNNQAFLFSFRYDKRTLRNDPSIFENAVDNFSKLRFIGIVEQFNLSMRIYEDMYSPFVPEFQCKHINPVNVTGDNEKSVEEKLDQTCAELGPDLFAQFQEMNSYDIFLYNIAIRKLEKIANQFETD